MAILNIEEAADYLRMSRRSLDVLVREGKVPATQLVGRWIFSEAQLVDLVEQKAAVRTVAPPAKPGKVIARPRRRNAVPAPVKF